MKKKKRRFGKKWRSTDYTRAKAAIAFFILSVPIFFALAVIFLLHSLTIEPPHPVCAGKAMEEPTYTWTVPVTAYSSTVDQTDSTPFITANGTTVHWGVIAANFLRFDTCVRFPDLYGDQWFVVEDRKHERFSESIDIWFPTREEAQAFGFQTVRTEIWE